MTLEKVGGKQKKKGMKMENVDRKECVPSEINTSNYYGCKVSSLLVGKSRWLMNLFQWYNQRLYQRNVQDKGSKEAYTCTGC